jgi:hypothetical protein
MLTGFCRNEFIHESQCKDGSNLYVVKQTLRKSEGIQQWQCRDTGNIRNKAKTKKQKTQHSKLKIWVTQSPLKKLEVNTGPHVG